ncbi:MAG: HAD family phosphatase [Spirochaetes bacterium]|nr:HAD family phosphatase [Spirochaetota bacterium]
MSTLLLDKFEAVVFDFDGTLVDSEPWYARAWEETARIVGITEPPDFNEFIGVDDAKVAATVIARYQLPLSAAVLQERYKAVFHDRYASRIAPYPDTLALLQSLKELNIPTAVASNSGRKHVLGIAGTFGMTGYIRHFVCADDVARKKPYPDMYQKTCELIGHSPDRCIAIEDSVSGVAAAVSAGLYCIALTTSFPLTRLSDASTHAATLSDVRKLLQI